MKRTSTWLAVTAAVAVLAFGAVQPWAVLFVECMVAAIALAEFWTFRSAREALGASRTMFFVLLVLALLPLFQLIPLPGTVLQVMAPARALTYPNVLGPWNLSAASFPVSVQSYATLEAWLRVLCYLLVFLLALSWERLRLPNALAGLLMTLGLFEAVYGLVQYLTGFQYIFAYAKHSYIEEATGTYINRNHYAGFLEMVLPFLLAAILFPPQGFHAGHRRWASLFTDESFGTLRQTVGFAVVCLALFFSRSRMGIISAAITVALIAVLAMFRRGRKPWPALALVLAVPLLYSLWVGVAPVSQRFETLGPGGDAVRLEFWKDAVTLIRENPFFGAGVGTYYTISPLYQTHFFQWRIDHAHNDYLEWTADMGIPAALLLFGSLWWIAIRLAAAIRHIERRSDLVLAAGCCGALCSLLLHSFADFNTQIPANAMILAWIAGTGAGLLDRLRRPVSESRGI